MAKPRIPRKVSDDTDDTNVTPTPEAASNQVMAGESNGHGGATKAVRTKTSAKPAIVKSEPRANLVPINLEDEIRSLAYLMAEARGFEPGHESDDWFAAEREVRHRYHQYSA
jgi:hypothetical protein